MSNKKIPVAVLAATGAVGQRFIQLLEGLHPLDAEILCLVKDKKLTNKYKITREIISEAYPDIIWERR